MYYIIFVYMHVLFFIYSFIDLHICVYEKRRYRTLVIYRGNDDSLVDGMWCSPQFSVKPVPTFESQPDG